MANDYNSTMNLPKTDFPMRASLPQKEPEMIKDWDANGLYYKMIEHNQGKPSFMFHDGPPYANASIHLGTALNKTLKDIIVRSKNMLGYCAPYIPGWDTHGLPIELKALAELGIEKPITPVELRQTCRTFAKKHVEIQKGQFKRLGTLADYNHPYITLDNAFEAKQIEIFGAMAKKGYIYKGLKPVHWCPDCQTALAEAEIEYAQDPCTTVYVKFQVTDDKGGLFTKLGADLSKTYMVIWTTTIWTLPANLALCVGPKYDYVLVKANDEFYVIAQELLSQVIKAAAISDYSVLGSFSGADLELCVCKHPFIDRDSLVIVGDHVTLESGTGIVHTAPGHGLEDFEVCNHYPQIPILVPVDNKGCMTQDAGQFAGLTTAQANEAIYAHIKENGSLFADEHVNHQYPHCWRCKQPILFRATEQWFCSVDQFKDQAVEALRKVHWIPGWGEDRMAGMVQDRSDWCISRQRTWGVPIPIFFCKDCGKEHITDESITAVSELFKTEGSDAWYTKDASDILPKDTTCSHCGGRTFTKETDIMDVWFDSGVTHAAVLDTREGHSWPADLYLEGADQYRGWFQSSLLTAVAWRDTAPYREVCTHGWVVDGEGKKMSKSLGNGMLPEDITDQYGADILRLWVASSDYHSDIRISKEILKQLSEVYRKIRNTARYILGNLYDFDPDKDMVSDAELFDIDRWALATLSNLSNKVRKSYGTYEFYTIYHAIHNFCTVDMSNFYLDVLKDRLYVEAADSGARRAAQTTIYQILRGLTLMLAPIIPFTAEEIWRYLPKKTGDKSESVVFHEMPSATGEEVSEAFMAKWERIHEIRDSVNKVLEAARAQKKIGKSLEAKVILHAEGTLYDLAVSVKELLPMVLIVSQVEVSNVPGGETSDIDGLGIEVFSADGVKCERCWSFSDTVGKNHDHATLCARCAAIIK
ncbi:MAG: isoleucine--tRNA ligase [Candidatus Fimivivens sp.]